jgi:phage/plasmid-like protein (TIGR03299 family)
MSAEIYTINNEVSFTRREGSKAAWHRLGGETPVDAPLEVWAANAKMDFEILSAPVKFNNADNELFFPGRNVLYRNDNHAPLGVVSDRYQVVQPIDVLEFFRDLTEAGGYHMDTAGVLKNGGKYWALATNDIEGNLSGDIIKPYLLLATACDGSLATTAQHTTVRVVCQNTLSMATENNSAAIKVPHSTTFDAAKVKNQLGIGETFEQFMATAEDLASKGINTNDAVEVIWELCGDTRRDDKGPGKQRQDKVSNIIQLFHGGIGANLISARGTRWGLLNAVTQYVDHEKRARSIDNRLESAWFGSGNKLKSAALELLAA